MRRAPLRGPPALVSPPLKPGMRNVMIKARSQARRDFGFNLTQRGEHRLLRPRRIQPREISLR
jgi:hypothetical protein